MKKSRLIFLLGIVLAAAAACSKSKDSKDDPGFLSVLGKWELVKDSTLAGSGIANSYTIITGTVEDYWDFRIDGKVYSREGAKKDTAGYTVYAGGEISIQRFGWIFNNVQTRSKIRELTAHSLVIHSADILPPGGVNIRTLYLKR